MRLPGDLLGRRMIRASKFGRSSLCVAASLFISWAVAAPQAQAPGTFRAQATTAQIMALNYFMPNRIVNAEYEKHIQEPDLSHRKSNPNSPPDVHWALSPGASETNKAIDIHPTVGDPPLYLARNYSGPDLNSSGWLPPDSMGAVGPGGFLVEVNGRIRSFDMSGNVGALDATTDAFWAPILPSGAHTTDPRVKFDPFSNRWIILMDCVESGGLGENPIFVAYSNNQLITASTVWSYFSFLDDQVSPLGDTGDFADYPTLGLDQNALYIGTNMFSSAGYYQGSTLFVIPKSQLLSGGSTTVTAFRDIGNLNTGGPYTPQGADNFVQSAQGTGYVVGIDLFNEGVLDYIPINNPGTTPTMGTMKQLSIPAATDPVAVTPPGSSQPLDPDDQRLMNAVIAESQYGTPVPFLWAAHHIGVTSQGSPTNSGTQNAARFYMIGIGATPHLTQSGTIFDPGGTSFLYPSIAMQGQGDAVMAFTQTGPNLAPRAVLARRVPADPLGSFPTSVIMKNGSGTYNTGSQNGVYRWGDYSFTSVAPYDDMTVWTIQEFLGATNDWQVQVAAVTAVIPPTLLSALPNPVAHGYTGNIVITGGLTANGQGWFVTPDEYTKYGHKLTVTLNGTSYAPTLTAQNKITISTSGMAIGSYPVAVSNPDSQHSPGSLAINVVPAMTGLVLSQTGVIGGNSFQATATLEKVTPAAAPISLSVPAGSPVTPPASFSVPAGAASGGVSIPTTSVSSATTVVITAKDAGGVHQATASITVEPANAVIVNTMYPTTHSVIGGNSVGGTIVLSNQAPSGGTAVTLSTSNPAASFATSPVTVPQGSTSAPYTINTVPVAANTFVALTATCNGVSDSNSITVDAAQMNTFVFASNNSTSLTVKGGTSVTVNFGLNGNTASGGPSITFSSSNTGVATIPTPMTLSAGSNGGSNTVTTQTVAANTTVTLTATCSGVSKQITLTLTP